MQSISTTILIDQIRRAVPPPGGDGIGDGELLGNFIASRDEAAFAVLVARHGPMVWGVCRRMLHQHDAEDAFQAAFLVLARKATSIRSKDSVGNWLYGVAHQTALQARRTAARRKAKEVQVTTMPETEAVPPNLWNDLQPLLDEELSRLPDIYRSVIVLCDLEGRTRKEAAGQLGVPEGTVAGRMARARALLAKRLTQRGVALSGGALATLLVQHSASASVPKLLAACTIKAAGLYMAGKAAVGAVPVQVAVLTEGVMKAMLFNKLKSAVAVALMLGCMAIGGKFLTRNMAAGQEVKTGVADKPAEAPTPQEKIAEKEKEAFTAWGEEINGLQAGLGFQPGEKRVYQHGETIKVVLRIRNNGRQEVEFKHIWAFFVEHPPTIKDSDGTVLPLPKLAAEGAQRPRSSKVAPGKNVDLYVWEIQLQEKQGVGIGVPRLSEINGTGKFNFQCKRIVGPTSGNPVHPNPAFDKLATGILEIAVAAPKSATGKPERGAEDAAKAIAREKELQKERREVLKTMSDQLLNLLKAGNASIEEVCEGKLMLLKADLDLAENNAERIKIHESIIDSLKDLESLADQLHKSGRGTNASILKAKARRLEAEINLLRAKRRVN